MNEEEATKLYAVIRVKGTVNVFHKVRDTLKILNVERPNYMTLVPNTKNVEGMLKRGKDYLTWGEINIETLEYVIKKRGEIEGKHPITDEYLKENSPYKNIREFAEALINNKAKISDIPNMKKMFRLHPPKKGYKTTKKQFASGGDLGYRGDTVNELVVRMA